MSAAEFAFTSRRNALLILMLAYAAFVALSMVNNLVGVAWPSIRETFALPPDALGVYLVANTISYVLASALSGRLLAKLNTGMLLAGCCALSGLTLVGIGGAPTWALVVALGTVVGLSGGALDGGINADAAHFSPRAVNWMHGCFGIGAALAPAIMTAAIAGGLGWRVSYMVVAAFQLILAAPLG